MFKNIAIKFILFLSFFLIFNNGIYASGSCESGCKIKNGTPQFLLDYSSDVQKIISNFSKSSSNSKSKKGKSSSYFGHTATRIYNLIFNWKEVGSSFDTFMMDAGGAISEPVKRDLKIFEDINDKLEKLVEKLEKDGNKMSGKTGEEICDGVKNEKICIEKIGGNIENTLAELIKNNKNIMLLMKKEMNFLGTKDVISNQTYSEIFLVPEDFSKQLKQNYNIITLKSCSECEGGNLGTIKKSIKEIGTNSKNTEKGTKKWQKAWAMLIGNDISDEEDKQKEERKQLEEKLKQDGIATNNGEATINEIKKHKGNTNSLGGDNAIYSSYRYFKDHIKFTSNSISPLRESISEILGDKKDDDKVPIDMITQSIDEKKSEDVIFKTINETIQENQAIIGRQDKNSAKLFARVINLTINVNQAINTLEKVIPTAEKICNDQDSGAGKCNYR